MQRYQYVCIRFHVDLDLQSPIKYRTFSSSLSLIRPTQTGLLGVLGNKLFKIHARNLFSITQKNRIMDAPPDVFLGLDWIGPCVH